uniref:WSC domain-containing protein n=1 Tax=Macrostomum lignano TaxID=282301 RepID=A0A1I8J167_9PLAT
GPGRCAAAAVPPQPLEFRHLGCYVDGGNGNRDLVGLEGVKKFGQFETHPSNPAFGHDGSKMTLQLCSQMCSYGRFRYFGVQSAGFCCCGSAYGSHGIAQAGDCSRACTGNSVQICGGGSRNSIYELTYPQINPVMPKLPLTSLPNITASASSITHRNIAASSAVECATICYGSPDCQGCAFVPSSRMCRLLRFAAVPAEVASETEGVWMKL